MRWLSFITLLLFMSCLLQGQNRKQLEEKRKALLDALQHTDQLLQETKKNRALTYERYIATQEQIQTRKELIQTIKMEIASYNASMERTAHVIVSLEQDIARLKEDYEVLLQMAYRRKLMKSDLLFIFSSDSFNKAYKRWQYLKQYDRYRKRQAQRIIETQKSLERKIALQQSRKVEQEQLLANEKQQLSQLENELAIKNKLLKTLKRNEKELRAKIKTQQAEHETLNQAIEGIIEENILATRKRNRQAPTQPQHQTNRPQDFNTPFENQRGQLPWPVQGVISSYFGEQRHPTLKDITINNSGIDILTHQGADIYPIAAGEVAAVRFMPGNGYLVIIQHGNYYTLYANLEEHFVKKGDRVQPSKAIGQVMTDDKTDKTELHFEVWRQHQRLNPRDWIAKK